MKGFSYRLKASFIGCLKVCCSLLFENSSIRQIFDLITKKCYFYVDNLRKADYVCKNGVSWIC